MGSREFVQILRSMIFDIDDLIEHLLGQVLEQTVL